MASRTLPPDDYRALDDRVRDLMTPSPPPADLRARVFARVRGDSPARVSPGRLARMPRGRSVTGAPQAGSRMPWLAAAAAVLILIGVLGALLGTQGVLDGKALRDRVNQSVQDAERDAPNIIALSDGDRDRPRSDSNTNASVSGTDNRTDGQGDHGPEPDDATGDGDFGNGADVVEANRAGDNVPDGNDPRQSNGPPLPDDTVDRDDNTPAPDDRPPSDGDRGNTGNTGDTDVEPPPTRTTVLVARVVDARAAEVIGHDATTPARPLIDGTRIAAGEAIRCGRRDTIALGFAVKHDAVPAARDGDATAPIDDGPAPALRGQLILHGETEIAIDPAATAATVVLSLGTGEILLDTACLFAPGAVKSWRVRVIFDDSRALEVEGGYAGGQAPFAAVIERTGGRRDRLSVLVLAGGGHAQLAGVSLAGAARATLDLYRDDAEVDIDALPPGAHVATPDWVLGAGLDRTVLLDQSFELESDADLAGWDRGEVEPLEAANPEAGHAFRLAPGAAGRLEGAYFFGEPGDYASYLPHDVGFELRFRVRAEDAAKLTLHVFDFTDDDNYAIDRNLPAGEWVEIVVPFPELRDRTTMSHGPGPAQRFIYFSVLVTDNAVTAHIDDVQLVRRLP